MQKMPPKKRNEKLPQKFAAASRSFSYFLFFVIYGGFSVKTPVFLYRRAHFPP